MEQTKEQALRANAKEWAQSLSLSDIQNILLERRHSYPEYSIKALIQEEQRRKSVPKNIQSCAEKFLDKDVDSWEELIRHLADGKLPPDCQK